MNLVVGASGMLGGRITRALIDRGKPVRVLVRRPSDTSGADTAVGDLKDRDSLDAACRGVTTVITTANSAQRSGADTVTSVDLDGNRALIDAAINAGVSRFVFVSVSMADTNSPVPLFAAKARTEEYLRHSGLGWTILAPHAFLDVWYGLLVGSALAAGAPVALVGGGRARHSFIAVDDVAAFATAVVDHPAAVSRRLVLGGPEALSWSDLVEMTTRILGKPVSARPIEPGQPIPTLPPPLDAVAGGLAASLEMQDVVLETRGLAQEFGVTPTPAEVVLRRALQDASDRQPGGAA